MERPLQVYLDDADLKRLDRCARERGWTKSQAVRLAVRALTRSGGDDPLLRASGMIDGLPSDLSAQFDRYLADVRCREARTLRAASAASPEDCSSIAAPGPRRSPSRAAFSGRTTAAASA